MQKVFHNRYLRSSDHCLITKLKTGVWLSNVLYLDMSYNILQYRFILNRLQHLREKENHSKNCSYLPGFKPLSSRSVSCCIVCKTQQLHNEPVCESWWGNHIAPVCHQIKFLGNQGLQSEWGWTKIIYTCTLGSAKSLFFDPKIKEVSNYLNLWSVKKSLPKIFSSAD